MPRITFLPSKISGIVPAGKTLLEAARLAGVPIAATCGGKALCGKCRVRVIGDEIPGDPGHEHALSPAELESGWRLACRVTVERDLVVEVPEAPPETAILTEFGSVPVEPDNAFQVRTLELDPPSLTDQASDLDRLTRALGRTRPLSASLSFLRALPQRLRQERWHVEAVVRGDELLDVGRPRGRMAVGLAVDVGTTTLAGVLVDLATGENLATAARTNPQALYGEDVLSRIEHASQGPEAVVILQRLVAGAINEIAQECAKAVGLPADRIYEVVAAGNTIMEHLLLGVSPEAVGTSPFVPAWTGAQSLRAVEAGIHLAPEAPLFVMPNVSGYVGGDVVAGLLAHAVREGNKPLLYIDIGTNGEIALWTGGRLYACSTAAGPAFEGARISCGMRAASGAIAHVGLEDGDLRIETLGREAPRGLCGTGLLDAIRVLCELGVVDATGRLLDAAECPTSLPPAVRRRLVRKGPEPALRLSPRGPAGTVEVALTQRDVRELQLAKGAIAAGVHVLLAEAGLSEGDLSKILLAGAFGSFLRPESARRVGLIPRGVPLGRVESVGNGALAGARAALLSRRRRGDAEPLARSIRYLELSGRPDFQELFVEALAFPAGAIG
ncbi:MAG: ASKHA domain-containing protein [Planctomycetota bacterium]